MDDADELEQCWLMLAMTYVQATKFDEALELCKKVLNVNKVISKKTSFFSSNDSIRWIINISVRREHWKS